MKLDHIVMGHIVLAHGEIPRGYVAIHQGKVVKVGAVEAGYPEAVAVEDFGDDLVFPGAIDAQVHSRSQLNNEDFTWSTSSAAAGGVTTIVDMPYDAVELICNADSFNRKKEHAAATARVDFSLYGTIKPADGVNAIREQILAGAIGFKLSTFGTDPVRFPRISPVEMEACMREVAKYGLIVGAHNEDDETVKTLIAYLKEKQQTDYSSHSLSRPIYAENLAIHQIYELGAETGCAAHVVHCSNQRGYQICKSYQQQGFQATIEGCLHYFILSEEDDVSRLKGKAKVNPPIRGRDQREALWQELAASNITVVSTDHVSWSIDRKNHENMFDNSSGATGLSVMLPLMIDGARKRGVPLTRLAQVFSYNPARLFRIDHCKGALEQGKDADLVVIRKDPYSYQADLCDYNFCKWSPYEGKEIDYQVTATMVRGNWVYKDQKVIAEAGNGQFIFPLLHQGA